MGLLPSREMRVNAAWLAATTLAADLRTWLQLLALDGELTKATPKTLRYRILHVPARLVRGQRKRRLKLPDTWPWATAIIRAFKRILTLPHLTSTNGVAEHREEDTHTPRDRGTWRHPARQPTRTPERHYPRPGNNATSRARPRPTAAVKQRGRSRPATNAATARRRRASCPNGDRCRASPTRSLTLSSTTQNHKCFGSIQLPRLSVELFAEEHVVWMRPQLSTCEPSTYDP
ncbi:transposase [Streptomyces sp. NPDC058394]|uniref:transposase n=1 Tax=Streptomyces sp. NPDC058394 TaxID=3346477 RepID=UPI003665274C